MAFELTIALLTLFLEFTDHCATALNKKLHTIAIFLDLSKAFDTVNKTIMFGKLERMGFRVVINDWF